MNRYDLLKQILEHVEVFEKEKKTGDELHLRDFAQWLNAKTQPTTQPQPMTQPIVFDGDKTVPMDDHELGTLVSILYRYVKIYAKQAMENSPLNTVDEFTYLIIALVHGAMSKTELIAHNVHEKTTGMEIIKRLTKAGFLEQTAAIKDGRSQLVAISAAGQQVLFPLLTEMRKVSMIANGNLTEGELNTLIGLLKKLEVFHKDLLSHEKTVDLNTILEKYF